MRMNTAEVTEKLLQAKAEKGLSFEQLGQALGRSEVWTASLVYGQATASLEEAQRLTAALGLEADTRQSVVAALTRFAVKGGLTASVPTDPAIYRFHEMIQVYGMPLKAVIQEKFGDGIMSAIDFTMYVEKEEDPKGDRVKITMSGKFLPYKKW